MPCNFEEYDLDKNGSIEVAEFLRVAHGYGHEGTGVVFAIIDSNGSTLSLSLSLSLSCSLSHRQGVLFRWWHCDDGRVSTEFIPSSQLAFDEEMLIWCGNRPQ